LAKLNKYIKIIVNLLIAIGTILIILFVVPKLLEFFLPFVIGWMVAMIANPLVRFMEKKVKILRKHSSAIIIVVVIAAIVGVLYLLISMLIRESKQLANDLPSIIEQTELQFTDLSLKLRRLSNDMPDPVRRLISKVLDGINRNLMEFEIEDNLFTISVASSLAQNIAEFFLTLIVTILSAYFFTAKRDDITASLRNIFPSSIVNGWRFIYTNFSKAVGGYFKAQFKIMLVLCILMFAGFEIAEQLFSAWPVLLIVLGGEILYYLYKAKEEQPKIKYDMFSIFMIGIIFFASVMFYKC